MDTSGMPSIESGPNRQLKIAQRLPFWYKPFQWLGAGLGCITLIWSLFLVKDHSELVYSSMPLSLLIVSFTLGLSAIFVWVWMSKHLLDPVGITKSMLPQNGVPVSSSMPKDAESGEGGHTPSSDIETANTLTDLSSLASAGDQSTISPSQQETHPRLDALSPVQSTAPSQSWQDDKSLGNGSDDPKDKAQKLQFKQGSSPSIMRETKKNIPVPDEKVDFIEMSIVAVPRDGMNLKLSADKKAYSPLKGRYALADGVSTSFLPGPWAQLVAKEFVHGTGLPDDKLSKVQIANWLQEAGKQWRSWVEEEWIPQATIASGQTNWDREIRRGASTTFIGCSFSVDRLQQYGKTDIYVTAVGDAVFFLVERDSSSSDRWTHSSYHLGKAEEFGHVTETLASRESRMSQDWDKVHQHRYSVTCSHTIVLATDALAQWIMRMKERDMDPWQELFELPRNDNEAFKQFVDRHRATGAMEIDDTTMMMIGFHADQGSDPIS